MGSFAEMLVLLGLCLLCPCLGVYVPGTPGADWTGPELVVVKAKLYSIFRYGKGPKALRLGFHDCLKYTDGTGGCDGCLNWHNVGTRRNNIQWVQCENPDVNITDNNGLADIVQELERIYTEPNYPWNSPKLLHSLRDSGKSRADLWAYASMVAVEFGTQMSNLACRNRVDPRFWDLACVHDNSTNCEVRPTRNFVFETGRADCTEHDSELTYKATKEEHHPKPMDNGRTTVQFFKNDFDFSGRETAAIMGSHSYGSLHMSISMFPYIWTSSARLLMNNDYYKSMTGQDRWFFDDKDCTPIGDAYGRKPKTRWVAHARGATHNGGPIFWIKENLVCPNRAKFDKLNDFDKACLDEAGPGMTCRADPPSGSRTGSRTPNQEDGNVNQGCERYNFIVGRDEVALNCDIGLYLDFNVDERGIPSGCTGLEHFNSSVGNPCQIVWSSLPGQGTVEPQCSKQSYAEPPGSQPIYQIMEEYANDQTTWIDDYIPAHEKMVRNGYPLGLNPPPQHPNIICPLPSGHDSAYCYFDSPGTGVAFQIGSRFDKHAGKVIERNKKGIYKMRPNTGEDSQFWQWSESGNQLMNVATGEPLVLNGETIWEVESRGEDFLIKSVLSGNAIDAYQPKLATWRAHGGPNQLFYAIFSS